ncbi:MAG: response regulator [Deltaproteobacteria bacterium]|nr:response regulator [Deltaproteobacteria bacterium]
MTQDPTRRDTLPASAEAWRGRVLVAEDDRELSVLLGLALELEGWTVDRVYDGEELIDALAACHGDLPDVVVTDVRMGGASGIDVLASHRPDAPVLVMSAFMDDALARASIELGASAVLAKPFDLDVLVALVATLAREHARSSDA